MKNLTLKISGIFLLLLIVHSCVTPPYLEKNPNRKTPEKYTHSLNTDTSNSAYLSWKDFFKDTALINLIDIALKNNQELHIIQQEINIAQNSVRFRKAQYLPFINLMTGAGLEKPARYTFNGAVEENIPIADDKKFPDPLPDFLLGAGFSWEVDIWKKLRNSKKAAVMKYLASIEGKNYAVTHLVSEIASLYYELLSLDNQLQITENYITLTQNALDIIKQEKTFARSTELAVKRFEAEVFKNQSKVYYLKQQIVETENKLNFLLGRYPQPIPRQSQTFLQTEILSVKQGIPSQLLRNRPDILQSEKEMMAAAYEVKSSKAEFYPSLRLDAVAGYQSFQTSYLFRSPESIIASLVGELISPLVNRNALKANYFSAIAEQNKAAWKYEQKVLNAYTEVSTQLAALHNYDSAFVLKKQQTDKLNESVDISVNLYKNARADYMEVLLTQRDALEARFELIETKKQQMHAAINLYRSLGGGWR